MASGGSNKSKKNALRNVMRSVPEGEALFEILINLAGPLTEMTPAHDRTAAIVGATYVEHALKQAIKYHLKPDADDPEYNYLFDTDDAPWREFASRVRLARGLGIITLDEFKRLEIIRRIRNAFAHTMADISFDTQPIADYCGDLFVAGDPGFGALVDTFHKGSESLLSMFGGPRRTYVHAVFLFYWNLAVTYPPTFFGADMTTLARKTP